MVVENKYPAVVKIASVLVILVLTIYGMVVLRTVLVPLAFSILFAMLLYPLCQRLERWKFSRLWAILVCLLVMVAVLGLLLTFIYSQLMNFAEELPQMAGRANELLEQVQVWVEKTFQVRKSTQIPMLKNSVTEWASTHSAFFASTLSATTSTLGTISLLPILIFFFLLYRDFFRKFFYRVFKETST